MPSVFNFNMKTSKGIILCLTIVCQSCLLITYSMFEWWTKMVYQALDITYYIFIQQNFTYIHNFKNNTHIHKKEKKNINIGTRNSHIYPAIKNVMFVIFSFYLYFVYYSIIFTFGTDSKWNCYIMHYDDVRIMEMSLCMKLNFCFCSTFYKPLMHFYSSKKGKYIIYIF